MVDGLWVVIGYSSLPINCDVARVARLFCGLRNVYGEFSEEIEKDFFGMRRIRNGGAQRTII
jgi:hypothetical protein